MVKKLVQINSCLHIILNDEDYVPSTAPHIRDRYNQLSNKEVASKEAYKLVYRQLSKLCRLGLLKKEKCSTISSSIKYRKTTLFDITEFRLKPKMDKAEKTSFNQVSDALSLLRKEIRQSEDDFHASVAESEEYKRLYSLLPSMEGQLETQYLNARERSNKLFGKLTAMKNVIYPCQEVSVLRG